MLAGFPIVNGLAPEFSADGGKGPKAIFYNWQFAALGPTQIELNMFEEAAAKQLDFVQGIYWHNNSANVFVLDIPILQQRIQIPEQTQGWLPVFAGQPPQFFLTIGAAADAVLPMHFYNVPMAPLVMLIV